MRGTLDRFLHYLEVERGLSQATVKAYRLDLGKGLIPFLYRRDKFDVAQVTAEDIRAYFDFLAYEKGNSNAARARKLAATKSFFNYLVENEGLKVSPAASLKSLRILERVPIYLTDDECRALLKEVSRNTLRQAKGRNLAMMVLFLHAGVRVSELINLKLTDVDLESSRMKITRKGGREQYLYLNHEAARTLEAYTTARPQVANDRFFVGVRGGNLSRNYVYSLVRKYLSLAGINKEKHGPHLFRHTFCTRLHHKGVDPFVIRDLAGHKSLATTMRYVKIESNEQVEAVDRLQFGFP